MGSTVILWALIAFGPDGAPLETWSKAEHYASQAECEAAEHKVENLPLLPSAERFTYACVPRTVLVQP
jgi:hypothetical protein